MTPSNNPIKLSVRVVTRRACARRAPTRPAAYRVRYADNDVVTNAIEILSRCLFIATAFVGLSCTNVRTVTTSDEVTVITAGNGISTGPYDLKFTGRVVRVTNGRRTPAMGVQFWRRDSSDKEASQLDLDVDWNGRFSVVLPTLVCKSGRHKWVHGTSVIVMSPGCRPVTLEVDESWKRQTIELSCEASPPHNSAVNPSHSVVTALAQGGKRRAAGRAGYRGRYTD